ncbi:hypothetical protein G9A89_017125 [Geosiphon pyriformis]|nr:hypothetical protein G9A89_017125 [Geosiphon pyriformis]
MVFSNRSSSVLEAKQSHPIGLPVLENWADQIKTESSPSLVSGAMFKIKLAHVKTVFQLVHGFLDAKSVSKDNVKLFCVEFASQVFLKAVFLVELTSSVHLVTLKIAKSLVVSESGFSPAAVALCNMLLGMFTVDIKSALEVFGKVSRVVLKSVGVWQYVVVYFKELNAAASALTHWSILVGKDSVYILLLTNQNETILCQKAGHLTVNCKMSLSSSLKTPKVFNAHFVGSVFYAKASAPPAASEFSPLVAFVLLASPFAASFAVFVVDSAVKLRLDSMKKQISDLSTLVKSVIEPIGSLIVLVTTLLNDNVAKTLKVEKDLLTMCNASKDFTELLIGVSKNFASLKTEVKFDNLDEDNIGAAKTSLLSENTIDCAVAL